MEINLMDAWSQVEAVLATYGLNVLGGLVLLVVGIWAAGRMARIADRLMQKTGCLLYTSPSPRD